MTTETQSMSSCFNLSVERIGYTFAYCLLFAVLLTGNALIGIVVYKTRSLRNPVNYFIANIAISDLLFLIFQIPQVLVQLNTNTWLIDGPLGQALYKLSGYLVDVSSAVSIQSLVIIAVDRFRAVVYPLRSPLISSKRGRFFILATWIITMVVFCPSLFTWKVVEHPEGLACVRRWKAAVGESSLKETFSAAMTILYLYFTLVFIGILYLIISLKMKANKIIGLQSVNVREQRLKRKKCSEDVHCNCVGVRSMLGAIQHLVAVVPLFFRQNNIIVWLSILWGYCCISEAIKLCCQSLHLFHFQWKLSSRS